MPDFGNAGKITSRKRDGAVDVKFGEGEYLRFKVTVGGPVAAFVFSCKHIEVRLASTKAYFPGHPQSTYSWDIKDLEPTFTEDTFNLLMSFISNLKYTYNVEHRRADHSAIAVIEDVDFESSVGTDKFREPIHVFKV